MKNLHIQICRNVNNKKKMITKMRWKSPPSEHNIRCVWGLFKYIDRGHSNILLHLGGGGGGPPCVLLHFKKEVGSWEKDKLTQLVIKIKYKDKICKKSVYLFLNFKLSPCYYYRLNLFYYLFLQSYTLCQQIPKLNMWRHILGLTERSLNKKGVLNSIL